MITGPVGVQSMNVGMREVYDLVWRLASIIRESGSPVLLEEYAAERLDEWRRLLGIGYRLRPRDGRTMWAPEQLSRLPACIPASGEHLTALLRQIDLEIAAAPSA